MQLVDEFGLHELVVIRNVQSDNTPAFERFGKLLPESVQVRFLHKKDNVRPPEMPFSDNNTSLRLRASRAHLKAGKATEDAFGREAPNPVTAADEEELQGMRLGFNTLFYLGREMVDDDNGVAIASRLRGSGDQPCSDPSNHVRCNPNALLCV